MFNRKSDYAINKKDCTAIIYQDAYGHLFRVTPEDFSSTEEFLHWRDWIQQENHAEEKSEHIHRNHTLSISGFEGYLSQRSIDEEEVNGSPPSDCKFLLICFVKIQPRLNFVVSGCIMWKGWIPMKFLP